MDKAVVTEYRAAQEGISVSYRDNWVNTTCQATLVKGLMLRMLWRQQ